MTITAHYASTCTTQQIVLVRLEEGLEAVPGQWTRARGDGLNPLPVLRPVRIPRACLWLRHGRLEDIERAQAYAEREGYTVVVLPTTERDPLGVAKRTVQEGATS